MDEENIGPSGAPNNRFYDLAPQAILIMPYIRVNQSRQWSTCYAKSPNQPITEWIEQTQPRQPAYSNQQPICAQWEPVFCCPHSAAKAYVMDSASSYILMKPANAFPIKKPVIERLCDEVIRTLMQSEMVVKLRPPLKIFGSLHGQYGDLMKHFAQHGKIN